MSGSSTSSWLLTGADVPQSTEPSTTVLRRKLEISSSQFKCVPLGSSSAQVSLFYLYSVLRPNAELSYPSAIVQLVVHHYKFT